MVQFTFDSIQDLILIKNKTFIMMKLLERYHKCVYIVMLRISKENKVCMGSTIKIFIKDKEILGEGTT